MLRRISLTALLIVVSTPIDAETDDVKEWHNQIVVRLHSNTRFPPQAVRQKGAAKVGFVLDRQGKLVSHWLAESTGNRALDEESLAILERAQPFPMPPPGLKEDGLTLAIPFVFGPRPGSSEQESGSWEQEQARLKAKVNSICRGC
jgi:protein TonB